MIHPKKKVSRSRIGHRRSHDFLVAPTVVQCKQCSEPMRPHRACPACGYYAGRLVVAKKAKPEVETETPQAQ